MKAGHCAPKTSPYLGVKIYSQLVSSLFGSSCTNSYSYLLIFDGDMQGMKRVRFFGTQYIFAQWSSAWRLEAVVNIFMATFTLPSWTEFVGIDNVVTECLVSLVLRATAQKLFVSVY